MIRGHDAGIMTCHAAVYFTLQVEKLLANLEKTFTNLNLI